MRSVVRAAAEAEALTQEPFCAPRARNSLREANVLLPWLCSVATHVCLDRVDGDVKIRLYLRASSCRAALDTGCEFSDDDSGTLAGDPKPKRRIPRLFSIVTSVRDRKEGNMPSVTHLLAATATVYGVLGATSSLLQARRMTRSGRSEDVSLGFLATITGGYLIWLLYGVSILNLPLIVVDSAGLACGAFTCSIAARLARNHSRGRPPASATRVLAS